MLRALAVGSHCAAEADDAGLLTLCRKMLTVRSWPPMVPAAISDEAARMRSVPREAAETDSN